VVVVPFFGSDPIAIRPQPWTKTIYPEELEQFSGQYYDFRSSPDLIETVLEDFIPYANRPAIKRFYDILRWMNSAESALETTDCAFRTPHAPGEEALFGFQLQCDGRLEFFHRDMEVNTDPATFYRFVSSFFIFLQLENRSFSAGLFEVSHAMTQFTALPADKQKGARICVRFIACGNTEAQAFGNLKVVFECLAAALKQLSEARFANR
jgi:hypothetical protein